MIKVVALLAAMLAVALTGIAPACAQSELRSLPVSPDQACRSISRRHIDGRRGSHIRRQALD